MATRRKLESAFERDLMGEDGELERMFPGAIILKNDSALRQGIPDRLLLWRDRWAAFEVKRSGNEVHQPNQDYYIQTMDQMSFASFIYPENKEAVLSELQYTFGTRR